MDDGIHTLQSGAVDLPFAGVPVDSASGLVSFAPHHGMDLVPLLFEMADQAFSDQSRCTRDRYFHRFPCLGLNEL